MSVGSAWYQDLDGLESEVRQIAGSPEIPGYVITNCLHRGGQGVVYAAREEASDRPVALKMLRDGSLATLRARRRFERELELLAQVDHPGIVGFIKQDRTPGGEPFLVMELIEGEPIDQHLEREAGSTLDARKRNRIVTLLIAACDAMRHAHRRGIIHRDLKPSNILVDKRGLIRIVDFGLARDIASETSLTRSDEGVMGSIVWMSPEHVSGSTKSIDARSDVYALGLIMHRLLSGAMPYDTSGSIANTLRSIELTTPSSCASVEHVGEDLAAVVTRCLAKDPNDRYQTVDDLSRDLQAVRDGLPIEIHRVRAFKRSVRALRRYRAAAALSAVTLLFAATTVLLLFALWRREAAESEQASDRTRVAQLATARAEIANGVLEGLLGSLENGAQVDAALLTRLERAAAAASSETDGALRTRLAVVLGRVYLALGRYEAAANQFGDGVRQASEAHGEDRPEIASALLGQAEALAHLANPDAIAEHGLSLRLRRRVFDPKSPELLVLLGTPAYAQWAGGTGFERWAMAEQSAQRALGLLDGPGHAVEYAVGEVTLAKLRMWQGRPESALQLFESARRHLRASSQSKHPAHIEAIRFSAHLLSTLGRLADAERDYREALLLAPHVHGAWVRPELLWELAWIRHRAGHATEAVSLFHQSLSEVCRLAASERADRQELGRLGERIESGETIEYDRLVQLLEAEEDYAPDGVSWYRFAMALFDSGEPGAAEIVFRHAIDRIDVQLGDQNAWYGRAIGGLGLALAGLGQFEEGLRLGRDSYQHACDVTGTQSPCRRLGLTRLASQLELAGRANEAGSIRDSLQSSNVLPGPVEILRLLERPSPVDPR